MHYSTTSPNAWTPNVSNNAASLGTAPPPRAYGLYRDGARIAALPLPAGPTADHVRAALDAAPYALLEAPRVLALGAAGGFRAAEALALGARHVTLVEPEPVLHRALARGLGPSPALAPDPRVTLSNAHPLTAPDHPSPHPARHCRPDDARAGAGGAHPRTRRADRAGGAARRGSAGSHPGRRSTAADAYENEAKPWAVGFGSALSDYLGQAYMTQVCAPKPDHTVLEIGTGSGFQSALLSRIVARQYSIEIIEPLGRSVAPVFAPLGYTNVQTRVGDGFFGWKEVEGGFDTIIVTCAAQWVPPALLEQLKPGGRLVIPIGQPFRRGQFLYIYIKDEDGRVRSRKDVGVYFIPMTGAMMNQPQSRGAAPG